jgi:hypothetical protein
VCLAPGDVRRDWLREWRAEIVYARHKHSSAVLVVRCLGAFVHAAWLRWERWRLEMLQQDIKYAIRTLTKKPGFAVVTILTPAIGIGATLFRRESARNVSEAHPTGRNDTCRYSNRQGDAGRDQKRGRATDRGGGPRFRCRPRADLQPVVAGREVPNA